MNPLEMTLSLLAGGAFSAPQISEITSCAVPTAYDRLRQIRKAGFSLKVSTVRLGKRGPKAKVYRLL
jgi:hypothetical protein